MADSTKTMAENVSNSTATAEDANSEEQSQDVVSQIPVDHEPGTESSDPVPLKDKEADSDHQTTNHAAQDDAPCQYNDPKEITKEVLPVEPVVFDQLDQITPGVTNQLQVRTPRITPRD